MVWDTSHWFHLSNYPPMTKMLPLGRWVDTAFPRANTWSEDVSPDSWVLPHTWCVLSSAHFNLLTWGLCLEIWAGLSSPDAHLPQTTSFRIEPGPVPMVLEKQACREILLSAWSVHDIMSRFRIRVLFSPKTINRCRMNANDILEWVSLTAGFPWPPISPPQCSKRHCNQIIVMFRVDISLKAYTWLCCGISYDLIPGWLHKLMC